MPKELDHDLQWECLLHEITHEIAEIASEEMVRDDADLYDEDWRAGVE